MTRFFIVALICILALGVVLLQAQPAAAEGKSVPKVSGKVTEYTANTSITVEYKVEGVVKKATSKITKFTTVQGTIAVGATVTVQGGDDPKNARSITVTAAAG